MNDLYVIEVWDEQHPRWQDLDRLITTLGQQEWVQFHASWHQSSVMLVAQTEQNPVGFLYYVLQEIGVEDDLPPVSRNGVSLREAKIIAFGVAESHRRFGIGRNLQESAIRYATQANCYQVRSHSSGDNTANHSLKLSMGFGVQPILRDGDDRGVYFILALQRK